MTFKKTIIICSLLFFPSLAFASTKDILSISFTYTRSTNSINILSIEQQVLEEGGLILTGSGNLKFNLADSVGPVSQNAYNLESGNTMELLGQDGGSFATLPDTRVLNLMMEITRPITAAGSQLTISKDGQELFNKKLSDLPIEILEVKTNRITTEWPEPTLPSESKPQKDWWIYLGVLSALIIVGIVGWLVWRKKQQPPSDRSQAKPTITPPAPPTPSGS